VSDRSLTAPYFPQRGDDGYRVDHYDLDLDYKVGPNNLSATARLKARAATAADGPLASVVLDLGALRVVRVLVDGAPARFTHRNEKLRISPPRGPIPAGAEFVVEIRYGGNPKPSRSPYGEIGWEQLTDGVIVASQPTGAPSWFPCNDRPDHKSTYRFTVTTSSLYHVAANGLLTGKAATGASATWVYEETAPTATYLVAVQIGRYQTAELAGPVPQRLVFPSRLSPAAAAQFEKQRQMMDLFVDRFGPYPFDDYTAVIADDELEIPVEAQGMSTFGVNHLAPGYENERFIAHELAHQWFGNSLTLGDWRDIWLHEGFAAYAEWLWSEASGGKSADEHARHWHRKLATLPQDLTIGDPGPRHLFDDRVYKRGALTVHALRVELGDAAFFAMLRAWTTGWRHSTVSTLDFMALVRSRAGRQLDGFFTAWLHSPKLPPLPER